jgi:hypothetical protein
MSPRVPISTRPRILPTVAVLAAFVATSAVAGSPPAPGGELFSRPFMVRHRIVQTNATSGAETATDPVTDYYGGSWIVSVHADGSRVILDFARREVSDIEPARGTYSVLSFDRLSELRRTIAAHRQAARTVHSSATESLARPTAPEDSAVSLRIEGLPAVADSATRTKAGIKASVAAVDHPGVQRLRVSWRRESGAGEQRPTPGPAPSLEVWLDPAVKLEPAAIAALERFGSRVIGGGSVDKCLPAAAVAAAERHTGGAFPVRTIRSSIDAGGLAPVSRQDLVERIEPLAVFPLDLLKVPEGYRRVPHPLEAVAAFLERETASAGPVATGETR